MNIKIKGGAVTITVLALVSLLAGIYISQN
ncbi:SCO family protein, partial [Legionella pneumophila]